MRNTKRDKALYLIVGAFIFEVLGFIVVEAFWEGDLWILGYLMVALGIVAMCLGCYIWVRLKNRHPAFALLGVSIIGVLFVLMLQDKSDSALIHTDESKNQIMQKPSSSKNVYTLQELRDAGILTQEEFEQKSKMIARDADEAQKIRRLEKLRDEGILTQEEFERKKNQILNA